MKNTFEDIIVDFGIEISSFFVENPKHAYFYSGNLAFYR